MAPAVEEPPEEEEIQIEQEDEAEAQVHAHDPLQPTAKQVAEHRVCHIPYRSWCKFCILGRGRGIQHRRGPGSALPVIGVDYFFITTKGVKTRGELVEELDEEDPIPADQPEDDKIEKARQRGELVKCIIVRDSLSKAIFAHVVPHKGVDEQNTVADMILSDVEWLGHSRIILKSDGEPAVKALVKRVIELAKVEVQSIDQIASETSAAHDSQSNGGTEVGVQLVRGLFRTLRVCLEERISKLIPATHALTAWLVEHAALLYTASVRGEDGHTAWGRARGRAFRQQLLGFGEAVIYKYPSKGPGHAPQGNMGPLGGEGVFLGYSRAQNTFVVGTEDGRAILCRSIARRPEQQRWRPETLAGVRTLPAYGKARPDPEGVRLPDAPHEPPDPTRPGPLRRMRINKSDFEKHGYTESCSQCRHIQRYGKAQAGMVHSEQCRRRIAEALAQTDEGKARLQADEERLDRKTAEHLEHADQQPRATEPLPAARDLLERLPASRQREIMERPPAPRQRHEPHPRDLNIPAPLPAVIIPRPTPVATRGVEGAMGAPPDEPPGETPGEADMQMDSNANQDVDMDFIGNMELHDSLGNLEPETDDAVSQMLLMQMGSAGRAYRRDKASAARKIVSEIYSPPRVTALLRQLKSRHFMPGYAFDLTTVDPQDGKPWDFSCPHKRSRARELLRQQQPYMLIGSPMCRAFSTWQALNRAKSSDKAAIDRSYAEAVVHIRFVCELYAEQVAGGRYFLHEHPVGASSWQLKCIQAIMELPGTQRVNGDQCMFGAEIQSGQDKGQPVNKPTGFMTNSHEVARSLNVRCTGGGGMCARPAGGRHIPCSGQHAKEAAKYPRGLCKAMLRGVRNQLKADDLMKNGCFGIQVPDDDAAVERSLRGPAQGYSGKFRDDLTGQVLRDADVRAARAKELEYFCTKGVWKKMPRHLARTLSGRAPISVRWVDVNKGDDLNPNYRSRLVARQIKALDKSGDSFFAPAPPLEALRTVLGLAVTTIGSHVPVLDGSSAERSQVSLVDIKRAYFNARIDPRDPPTFVQLPEEDADSETMCAQLLRHMYGTRMAADGWQEEYSTFLVSLGFRQGNACPNLFHHGEKQVVTSVHGDDFTSSGPASSLDWLETSIAQRYEISVDPRLGPGPGDAKEGRVLNRVIRWCEHGIEYEADPRQVERLVAECGLEGASSVVTPGVKPTFTELEEDQPLPPQLATPFRGAAARGNYLGPDRVDAQFACKEVCRWMSNPSAHAWKALKRICRFFNSVPRLVYTFKQQSVSGIDVYTDTDWAGCPKTRKSTSGGVVMLGSHAMKHWSSTQTSIALSSGEAEFAGVIRGAGQGLGYQALLNDLGVALPLRVWTDSSAAIGICSRQGLGKLRHLDTHTLWIQQAVRTRRLDLKKVPGEQNPADLLTKHSNSRQRLEDLVTLFGCRYMGGRAENAPQVRKGESDRATMAQADINRIDGSGTTQNEPQADEPRPIMPHLVCSATDLDNLYPNVGTPDDEGLDDLGDDRDDAVLQHGLKIAKEINDQSQAQGRRRRPRDAADGQEEDAQGTEEQQKGLYGDFQPVQGDHLLQEVPPEELEVASKDETVGNVNGPASGAHGPRRSARLPTVPPRIAEVYLSKSDLLLILSKRPRLQFPLSSEYTRPTRVSGSIVCAQAEKLRAVP